MRGRQLLLSDPELIQARGIPSTTGHRVSARETELKTANAVQELRKWKEKSEFLIFFLSRHLQCTAFPLSLDLGWEEGCSPPLKRSRTLLSPLLPLESPFQRSFGVVLNRKWDGICCWTSKGGSAVQIPILHRSSPSSTLSFLCPHQVSPGNVTSPRL